MTFSFAAILDLAVVGLAFLIGREVGAGRTVPMGAWALLAFGLVAFSLRFATPKDGGGR